jgi:hypothetical protein
MGPVRMKMFHAPERNDAPLPVKPVCV